MLASRRDEREGAMNTSWIAIGVAGLPLAAKQPQKQLPLAAEENHIDKMPMSVATQSLTEERSPYGDTGTCSKFRVFAVSKNATPL